MPNSIHKFLSEFFQRHLHFTPTASQIALFESDLGLVSPYLMLDALKELSKAKTFKARNCRDYRQIIYAVYDRKVLEQAQLFPVFHSFETAFRSTLAVKLEEHYGKPDWWADTVAALKAGGDAKSVTAVNGVVVPADTAHLFGQIVSDIAGPRRDFTIFSDLPNGYKLLDRASLSQISKLVTCHWGLFNRNFAAPGAVLTQDDFRSKFKRVTKARNRVYHHRPIKDRTDAIHTSEELLDYLNFSLSFVYTKISQCSAAQPKFQRQIEPRHNTY